MNNEHAFLTYNQWKGENHIGYDINHHGLSPKEIQLAVDMYTSSYGNLQKENQRLGNLVSELLNENTKLKQWKYWYDERHNAD